MKDEMAPAEATFAALVRGGCLDDELRAHGHYTVECRDKDGNLKWTDVIENVVCTVGKNLAFTTFLAGSAYTVTGPFMGLISSVSWSAVAAGDTMTSHSGWTEAGGTNAPQYSGTRPTCVWAAASAGAIALSSTLNFTFTSGGTVEGCFINFGTGALSTIDNTGGTLWSAGVFSGGARTVLTGDQLNVSYSVSM